MTDEEDRDARVVRRWRENQLSDDPPENITPEDTAYVEAMMKDWKPKPYVHPFEDIVYQDEEDTYPWGRPGWDPVAAMSSDYVVPREGAVADPADVEESHGLDVQGDGDLIAFVASPPEKTDPAWLEPTPGDKARVTALVTAGWSKAKMATFFDMTQPQFEWAFYETLKTGGLAMEARLTTAIFADAIASPGPARNRVADFMGVFKEKPDRAKSTQPRAKAGAGSTPNTQTGSSAKRLRPRFGGAHPKPHPDGCIHSTMVLGDTYMQTQFDVAGQRRARVYELVNAYRAAKAKEAR